MDLLAFLPQEDKYLLPIAWLLIISKKINDNYDTIYGFESAEFTRKKIKLAHILRYFFSFWVLKLLVVHKTFMFHYVEVPRHLRIILPAAEVSQASVFMKKLSNQGGC